MGHITRPSIYRNLADALHDRFRHLGDRHDLEEAISLLQTSSLEHGGSDIDADDLRIAGEIYLSRYHRFNDAADLDTAIRRLAQSHATTSRDIFYRRATALSLGEAYTTRYGNTGRLEDAEAATTTFEHPLLGQPEYYLRIRLLFSHTTLKFQLNRISLRAVLMTMKDGLANETFPSQAKLDAAIPLFNVIENRGVEPFLEAPLLASHMIDVYSSVSRLLQGVAYFGLDVNSRLRSLARVDTIAANVLVYGNICGRLKETLEILEQSRSVFWTQALRIRTPLDDVPDEFRHKMICLARDLERRSLASALEHSVSASFDPTGEDEPTRRRRQGEELKSLIDQIRLLPRLERFMLPPDFSTLKQAAKAGPVILLVSGGLSHDALILNDTDELIAVNLPAVTREWIQELIQFWDSVVMKSRRDARDQERLTVVRHKGSSKEVILTEARVLREIWYNIVEPVLMRLNLKKSTGRNRPRVWWCCTGNFSFLPIHAAGIPTESCSDFVVSSYTPSLQALLNARSSTVPIRRAEVRALLCAASNGFEEGPFDGLPSTIDEVRKIGSIVPPIARLVLPSQEDALQDCFDGSITVDTVMQNVPNANILHLACHGAQNITDPLDSGFILRDGKLTISRLMSVPLPRAFFAFMSACETAKGDAYYANQNIHLGAAMLFAGFKTVVGTMWSMKDVDGPAVAQMVYERLFEGDSEYLDADRIPYALDEAIQRLRGTGVSAGRWATYIHLGI